MGLDRATRVDFAMWFVLLTALLLYAMTLDTGLQPEELRGGDLITHQYAQVQARPSNAPGYPLYTMGGWLWFRIVHLLAVGLGSPNPNPMPLLSSYSTLWALLALWLLYRILVVLFARVRALPPSLVNTSSLARLALGVAGEQRLAALLTLFYAVTYFFWYYATTTEQYSSAIAQTLAIVYLYLRWQDAGTPASTEPRDGIGANSMGRGNRLSDSHARHLLWLLAFLCGLSLAHMLTVAFIVPPLVLVILWQAPGLLRQWRVLLLAVIFALLPLVSYLYVYLRGAAHPEWWGNGQWQSAGAWFWSFVSTSQGREELGWGFEPWCSVFANGFPALVFSELTWPVVGLGLLGFSLMGKRLAALFGGTALIYLAFSWAYRCGNWFQVILPLYPLLLIGVGVFVQRSFRFVAQRTGRRKAGTWLALGHLSVEVFLLAAIMLRILTVWPAVDSRDRVDDSALDRAAIVLAQPLPPGQALFAALDETLALQYLTNIWGIQPTLRVVSAQTAAETLAAGHSVLSTWAMAPTLHAELPAELAVTSVAVDPNWIRFMQTDDTGDGPPQMSRPDHGMGVWMGVGEASADDRLSAEQLLQQPLLPTVTLHRYRVQDTPHSPLAAYREPIADAEGVDLFLLWQVAEGAWPEDVAISVRLTAAGAVIEGAQIDRNRPATGLNVPGGDYLSDPYHFALTAEAKAAVDGALIILYRPTDGGFVNVAQLALAW